MGIFKSLFRFLLYSRQNLMIDASLRVEINYAKLRELVKTWVHSMSGKKNYVRVLLSFNETVLSCVRSMKFL